MVKEREKGQVGGSRVIFLLFHGRLCCRKTKLGKGRMAYQALGLRQTCIEERRVWRELECTHFLHH